MVGTLRITKIKFRAGGRPGSLPTEVQPGSVSVLVGPNNAGKSIALQELEMWGRGIQVSTVVIESAEIDFPADPEEAEQLLRVFESSSPDGVAHPNVFYVLHHHFRPNEATGPEPITVSNLRSFVHSRQDEMLRAILAAPYTVRLDGRNRFLLSDPTPIGDLQARPQNHLWALFVDDASRNEVRVLTEEAFGVHFVIDPTGMSQFRIRLSPTAPVSKSEEQGWDDVARQFHAKAKLISEFSDGIKSFVGLAAAVHSLPHRIILIDEPDAFLHPPLARRLGNHLASVARRRGASLITATHSADFLIGCLEAANDATVVRLTYDAGSGATARTLSSAELNVLTRDPLLRTTGVYRALFHRSVVVTESDTDRAFYDEVNRRMLAGNRGLKDTLFLNAQNWQTVPRLVEPLRRIGIPAAAVVDLDVIRGDGGWNSLLEACQIPVAERAGFGLERTQLANCFSMLARPTGGRDPIKRPGILALKVEDRERATRFLRELAKYGLFLVPFGEVESWLQVLDTPGHGSEWLVNLFSRIGQHENDKNYLTPSNDDVWQFIDDLDKWIENPNRLGVG